MGTLILRWFLSRKVRQAFDMGRQVRKLVCAQRDLLSPEEIQEISKAARELSNGVAAGDRLEGFEKRMKNLEKVANENLKPYPSASLRENIEVFLVTGAVVLALRTFFFQPMAIPSGSAQPTLWGITWDNFLGQPDVKFPTGLEKLYQSCWSGIHYYHEVAQEGGELRIGEVERVLRFIRKQTLWVGNKRYTFWFPVEDLRQKAGLIDGQMIGKGEEFIKLKVVSGDHLFVNRFIYNFQSPRRGDIIVFYSDHLPGLIEETHYIKRLIARGGEHVRIGNDRHVYINGERLDASTPGFENVYSFGEFDLRLMSIRDGNSIPGEGVRLVIVGKDSDGRLRFRILNEIGQHIVDKPEIDLPNRAKEIDGLRARVASLWDKDQLTLEQKRSIMDAVASIIGHTRFDPVRPPEKDRYSGHVNNFIAAKYGGSNLAPLFPDGKAEFVVHANHYLAFGDNTMNSKDGRDWGDFPRELVMGRASFVFWPIGNRDHAPSRFGWGYR